MLMFGESLLTCKVKSFNTHLLYTIMKAIYNIFALFAKTNIIWITLAVFTLNVSSCKNEELPNVIEDGTTGFLTWKFTEDGVLNIGGKGLMPDYEYSFEPFITPWHSYRSDIKTVMIGKGVTDRKSVV